MPAVALPVIELGVHVVVFVNNTTNPSSTPFPLLSATPFDLSLCLGIAPSPPIRAMTCPAYLHITHSRGGGWTSHADQGRGHLHPAQD